MTTDPGNLRLRDPTGPDRMAAFLQAHRAALGRQGGVQAFFKQRGRARYGPYYRIVLRTAGGQRVHYLGRDEALVRRARDELDRLRRPRREEQVRRKMAEENRKLLRRFRRQINALLATRGLRLKGWELRGLRGSRALQGLEAVPRVH